MSEPTNDEIRPGWAKEAEERVRRLERLADALRAQAEALDREALKVLKDADFLRSLNAKPIVISPESPTNSAG